jgi:hypothetical protein
MGKRQDSGLLGRCLANSSDTCGRCSLRNRELQSLIGNGGLNSRWVEEEENCSLRAVSAAWIGVVLVYLGTKQRTEGVAGWGLHTCTISLDSLRHRTGSVGDEALSTSSWVRARNHTHCSHREFTIAQMTSGEKSFFSTSRLLHAPRETKKTLPVPHHHREVHLPSGSP